LGSWLIEWVEAGEVEHRPYPKQKGYA
jgi:hypothetical protein